MTRAITPLAIILLACTLGAAGTAQDRQASDDVFSVVFRAAPLAEALAEVVRLTSIDLVYDASLVEGRRADCVRRLMTREQLLACVLAGTGLDFVRSSSGAHVLVMAPRAAAATARLAGRVVDARSGEPMPFAHVLLADAGTVADASGFFALAGLEPGEYQLTVTFVGYDTRILESVHLEGGASERVEIRLQPAERAMTPVVIDGLTQRLPSASLGSTPATGAPAGSASPTSDVMRGAAATLGVSAALPLADLHVQGGSTAGHVTRLDGVPVRDPVALGRHLGAFSPLAIGRIDVHKAGFDVTRGSHLTGAIDVSHDLSGAARAAVQADPVSLNARLALPVRGVGAYDGTAMVAVRRSTWDVYRDPGITELLERSNRIDPLMTSAWLGQPVHAESITADFHRPEVRFTDLHAAIQLRPDAVTTVHASLYRAGNFVAADRGATLAGSGRPYLLAFRDEYDWGNWAGQIRASRILGSRAVGMVRLRGSHHASSYDYWYHSSASGAERSPGLAELFESIGDGISSGAAHRLVELGVDAEVTLSHGPGRDLTLGASGDAVGARFRGHNGFVAPFESEERATLLAAYAHGRHSLGRQLAVEGGVRLTFLPAADGWFAEPRAAIRYDGEWAGTDGYALRLAGGVYRQFVHGYPFRSAGPASIVPELWFWMPAASGVPPARAYHGALDVLLLPSRAVSVRGELFARWEPRLAALDVRALTARAEAGEIRSDAFSASVRGHAFGAGLGIDWRGRRGSLAGHYAIERARRSLPRDPAGPLVAVPWEEPHRLAIDARLHVSNHLSLESAARTSWGRSWGLRHSYYEYLGDAAIEEVDRRASRPDMDRLPALVLLDARVVFEAPLAVSRIRLEAGMANVLNRGNVIDRGLDGGPAPRAEIPRLLPGRRATFAVRVDL